MTDTTLVIATLIMFIVAAVMLLAMIGGGWLCWVGFRGDVVETHPRCRRCGYDLVGQTTSAPRCPECGADTSAGSAVRSSQYHMSRGHVLAGLALLILGTTPLTLSGCFGAPNVSRAAPATIQRQCLLRGSCSRAPGEVCDCPFSRARAGNVAIADATLVADQS